MAIVYTVRCDSCPAEVTSTISAGDARRRGKYAGWVKDRYRTANAFNRPVRDLCPACAGAEHGGLIERLVRDLNATPGGAGRGV